MTVVYGPAQHRGRVHQGGVEVKYEQGMGGAWDMGEGKGLGGGMVLDCVSYF